MTSYFGLSFLIFFGIFLGSMAAPNLNGECSIPRIPNGFFLHFLSNKLTKLPHNSRAYVACENGYTAEGPLDIICQNGTWPSPLPMCNPKKCQPPSIVNGILSSKLPLANLIDHEKSVAISCNNGYTLNGTNNVVCLHGKWSPDLPSCDPRECQTELIENGILVYKGAFLKTSVSIAHGEQLIISCKNGYKMSEKAEITCHLGKWSSPFPHCKPESCIPKPVANGRILAVGKDLNPIEPVDHGLTLLVVCDSDYVLHGDGALACNKGKWSHDFPTCQPKFCLSSKVSNSKVLYQGEKLTNQSQIKHRSSIFVICDAGYTLIGTGMLTCSYGYWSHNIPECVPKGCHVQTVLQGSVSYLEKELTNACSSLPNGLVSHRHSVTVSCLEGFHRNGAEILTCSYGNWSEGFPKCEPNGCHVQTILKGKVVSASGASVSSVSHSQKVSIICDEGYELPKENKTHNIHCYYGNWTANFPSCISKNCFADIVQNGHVLFGVEELKFSMANLSALQVPHDHHVTVRCERGFNLTGTTKLTCRKGKWSEIFPTCQPSGCAVILVENGNVKEMESNVVLSDWGRIISHEKRINIFCKTGYELVGANNLKCLFGNWSTELPVCKPKSCAVVPVKNAHLAYPDSKSSAFVQHGNFLQVTCDHGFTLLGSKKVKCSEGSWCSTFPVCEPDKCNLKKVENGIISINHEDVVAYDRSIAHNTIVAIRCQPGFDLSGIPKVQCTNGKWSTEFPTCEGMTCKAVPIENGFLQVKSSGKTVPPDDDVSANETVEVKCDNGYNLKDDTDPIKCQMGKWNREFPVCQRDVFCELEPVDSSVAIIGNGPWVPGSVVKFKCHRPICELLGESAITCLENGKWSVDENPFCDCGAGCKALQNTKDIQVSFSDDGGSKRMTVICNAETHFPADNVTKVKCRNNKWIPRVPKCKPKSCLILDLPHGFYKHYGNSLTPGNQLHHGERIFASCEPGYHIIGTNYSDCEFGAFSDFTNIECKENECSAPERLGNYSISTSGNRLYGHWSHGSQVSINCPSGHSPKNGFGTAICNLGHWVPEELDCLPNTCTLPQLPNGYFLFKNHWPIRDELLPHGIFIEAFCDSHHQMHGEKLIGCYYGKWIPKIPSCEKKMCSALRNISISPVVYLPTSNATVLPLDNSRTSYPHGSTAQLKCNSSKYRPVRGISQSVCQFGKWSVDKLNCEPIPCPPLANATNSRITIRNAYADHIPHGSVAELHCDNSRFTPLGHNRQSVCEYGHWYPAQLKCEPRRCEISDSRETHYVLLNGERLQGEYVSSGNHINVVCEKKHLGVTLALCYQGRWVPPLPSCYDGSCVIHDVRFSHWIDIESRRISQENYVKNKTQVSVECQAGYRSSQESEYVFSCLNGRWSPQEPTCREVFCYIPGDLLMFVQEHEKHLVNKESHQVKERTALTIVCPPHSYTKYPVVSTCQENMWRPALPNCSFDLASVTTPVPVQVKSRGHHCQQPLRGDNVIFHWDIDIEEDNASIIPDGIGLHARCIDVGTFRLMGSIRLLCQNGIWLGKLPVCQKTEEDEMAPPTISIYTDLTWNGQQIDYSIAINGSIKVASGRQLELSCRHSLYEVNNLEWYTTSHTYPNFRNSLRKDRLQNTTAAHLSFPEAARQYSGRYTCRIKNTTIFHFVDIIIS